MGFPHKGIVSVESHFPPGLYEGVLLLSLSGSLCSVDGRSPCLLHVLRVLGGELLVSICVCVCVCGGGGGGGV